MDGGTCFLIKFYFFKSSIFCIMFFFGDAPCSFVVLVFSSLPRVSFHLFLVFLGNLAFSTSIWLHRMKVCVCGGGVLDTDM
jgi:hypothetical protein